MQERPASSPVPIEGEPTPSVHVERVARRELAEVAVAREIVELVRQKPDAVLGLATGRSPLGVYRELHRAHLEEAVDFSRVTTFNLDEYLGLSPRDELSFRAFMEGELFQHLNLDPERTHIPDGRTPEEEVEEHCARYEQAISDAGGIDLQLLGLGRNGHVGFNEPGSPANSRTRRVELHPVTRRDAGPDFGGLERVPTAAITMGVATIAGARRLRVLAFGPGKAAAARALVQGPADLECPATLLRGHPDLRLWVDPGAASELPESPSNRTDSET